ncbi:serine/threonine dehydratase [Arthrobacter sp. SO5]|uniref:serine/threonine dehydratase n=1 Tax=Arthrobacter sp. SO5 TaxID=1897055 RepID=UPI001E4A7924|nr:serine/threonine dehydratase [Arthrobacter sp. SO5]
MTRSDVLAAQTRMGSQVRRTPTMRIEANQLGAHPAFWLKLESLQSTGAFKARGALNSLLATKIPAAGVCAASGGNHGQAVAWAARLLGVPAAIFVPETCPDIKLRRLSDYGAAVTVIGAVYDESLVRAEQYAAETGAVMIHPFDQQLTVAGAGTVSAEFIEQVGGLDSLLIPVGGGGLLAGALAALAGSSTVAVAVEPYSARCLGAALEAGGPVDVDVSGPAVDSLGPRRVGQLCYDAAVAHAVQHVDVSDKAILRAQLAAWEELRIGLEGGGATALAALLSGAYIPAEGEVVGVLVTGGNVDLPQLLRTAASGKA